MRPKRAGQKDWGQKDGAWGAEKWLVTLALVLIRSLPAPSFCQPSFCPHFPTHHLSPSFFPVRRSRLRPCRLPAFALGYGVAGGGAGRFPLSAFRFPLFPRRVSIARSCLSY